MDAIAKFYIAEEHEEVKNEVKTISSIIKESEEEHRSAMRRSSYDSRQVNRNVYNNLSMRRNEEQDKMLVQAAISAEIKHKV